MSSSILILNAGSSSVKFALYQAAADTPKLAQGEVERVGSEAAVFAMQISAEPGAQRVKAAIPSYEAALKLIFEQVKVSFPALNIVCVGHRVVHGGMDFIHPVKITADVLASIEQLSSFAPLHQPHNLAGIRAAMTTLPGVPQLACFDTSFHRHHPWVNDVFGLPREYYDKGIRRYGFHGLSYQYIAARLAVIQPDLYTGKVIVAHLGNGASMCALHHGYSVSSTMGFTVLDGLLMGTRCGELDPGVILYLLEHEHMDVPQLTDLLYRRSGLLGMSGISNDVRDLERAGTVESEQAIEYFVCRIRREIGALAAVLGGLDGLIFCGGIGENSASIRQGICADMEWLGIALNTSDSEEASGERLISSPASRVKVMVIATDEEQVIAEAAWEHLSLE